MLNDPQKIIFDSTQEINLFMGGTGSGKTFLDGIISGFYIKFFPDVYGFIGANTYEQLNTSSLKRIRDTWHTEHGWKEGIDYIIGKQPPKSFDLRNHNFDNYSSIISFKNGAVWYKGSLDNYEVHSGKEFGVGILDETWMTKEEAVKDVILTRLRQKGIIRNGKDLCPLYISTTPAKVEWINDTFKLDEFEQEINSVIYDPEKYFTKTYDNKCVVICSIYHNKANLPENYIPNLIKEHTDRNGKLKESGKRLIFANPFVRAGGEFYSSFDRITHTSDVPYIDGLPINISFDFNVVPYITMTVWQVQRKDNILWLRQIDEFCMKSPLNKTEKLCQEFERHYSARLKHGLFYYGDATGKNQDTRGLNDYQIVEHSLRMHLNNFSKKVPYRNPSVSARRQFINNILDEKYNVRILIDRKCRETIRDFEFVKEDATGHKLKEKVKDELTGQSYEALGHTSDANDYFFTNCEIVKDIFNKEFKT
jgi:hypothetical protein